jgi:hypothetical protein
MTDEPKRPRGILRALGSSATPAVALVASAVALAFTLWPSLSPDPGTMLAATLKVEAVDRGATHYSYLEQYYPERASALNGSQQSRLRRETGSVVNVLVQIQGKKHGNVRLDYVAFDWSGKRLIEGQGEPTPEGFRADTPNDQWIAPIFVNDPALPGDRLVHAFFLRFRLFDGGVLLAFADTGRILAGA